MNSLPGGRSEHAAVTVILGGCTYLEARLRRGPTPMESEPFSALSCVPAWTETRGV